MMKLIHDEHLEVLGVERVLQVQPAQRLDGREDMVGIREPSAAEVQIAECPVVEHGAKCGQTLFKDLATMCDKKQPERRTVLT